MSEVAFLAALPGHLKLVGPYVNAVQPVLIECQCGHRFQEWPDNLTFATDADGRLTDCPNCTAYNVEYPRPAGDLTCRKENNRWKFYAGDELLGSEDLARRRLRNVGLEDKEIGRKIRSAKQAA